MARGPLRAWKSCKKILELKAPELASSCASSSELLLPLSSSPLPLPPPFLGLAAPSPASPFEASALSDAVVSLSPAVAASCSQQLPTNTIK